MAIDTQRLRLRPVAHHDVDSLHALDADPTVMRFVSGGVPTARSTIAEWVVPRSQAQFRSHGTGLWTAHRRSGDAFVGWVQLRLPRHTAEHELELSYRLHRSVWGRGLAAEAAAALIAVTFLATDTQRIFASTHREHVASQRVMYKLGMRLSAGSPTTGRPTLPGEDDIEYELLRDRWMATRGRHAAREPTGRHRRPPHTTREGA